MDDHNSEMFSNIYSEMNYNNNNIRDENTPYPDYSNFSCTTCGKCFTSKERLAIHRLFHTGDKTFSCKICNQKSPEMVELLTHMKKHRSEKPNKCRTFLRKGTKRLRRTRKQIMA